MFNRKKKIIESLKNNVKVLNDKRIELTNENIVYQKEIMALKQYVKENNEMLKKLTSKKRIPRKEVVKNER